MKVKTAKQVTTSNVVAITTSPAASVRARLNKIADESRFAEELKLIPITNDPCLPIRAFLRQKDAQLAGIQARLAALRSPTS